MVLASNDVALAPNKSQTGLATYASYLEDKNAEFSITEVLQQQQPFVAVDTKVVNMGLSSSKFWLKIPVRNTAESLGKWIISTGLMRVDHFNLYKVVDGRIDVIHHSNFNTPITERSIPSRLIYVPLILNAKEEATLIFEYQSEGITQMALDILSEKALYKKMHRSAIFDFSIMAFLIALACINLFHFIAVRRPAYFYYSMMMLTSVAATMQVLNYNLLFFFPDNPGLNRTLTPIIFCSAVVFAVLFTRSFFNLKELNLSLYRLSYLCLALLVLPCISVFIVSFGITLTLIGVAGLSSVLLMLSTGIFALHRRVLSAEFYIFAWVVYVVGMIYLTMTNHGIQLTPFTGFEIAQVVSALEGFILAMALAHQVRHLQKNHNKSQDQLIHSLEHNNRVQQKLVSTEREKMNALIESHKKSQHLAAASHDFSQPIQALRSSLEAVKRTGRLDTVGRHIEETLSYLQSLSNSLVEGEKEQILSTSETTLINEVFTTLFSRYSQMAEEKGLTFYFVHSSVSIAGNPLIITRILDNLISNALRYTDQGKVFFGLRRRESGVEIQVLDTGVGISSGDFDRVIQAYQQSNQNSKESPGWGLGLSIVDALCKEAGYQVILSSVEGRGSKFGILIPHRYSSA